MKLITALVLLLAGAAIAQQSLATRPAGTDKMPGVHVDIAAKQVRVDCEAIDVEAALEFFCVITGGSEHESLLRTPAKPSHIHLGLLMIGMEPGEGLHYVAATDSWVPPHGPPVNISVEFLKDGKTVRLPAYRLMRNIKTKQLMPPRHWIFVGSRFQDDGVYGADVAGYVVSMANVDLTVIDVPESASRAWESLEWEINPDTIPPKGAKVTMILEPAGPTKQAGQTSAAAATTAPSPAVSDVHIDQAKIDRLRQQWSQTAGASSRPIERMAEEHYQIIQQLRAEQSRLVNEAERVSRVIDELQKQYDDMVTPRPGPGAGNPKAE